MIHYLILQMKVSEIKQFPLARQGFKSHAVTSDMPLVNPITALSQYPEKWKYNPKQTFPRNT